MRGLYSPTVGICPLAEDADAPGTYALVLAFDAAGGAVKEYSSMAA